MAFDFAEGSGLVTSFGAGFCETATSASDFDDFCIFESEIATASAAGMPELPSSSVLETLVSLVPLSLSCPALFLRRDNFATAFFMSYKCKHWHHVQ